MGLLVNLVDLEILDLLVSVELLVLQDLQVNLD